MATEETERPRYFVATFGCRVNQADSEGIREALEAQAHAPALGHDDADVVVINSCTVTHRSDADIRKLVNRVHRDNPEAKVVVTGCYAQRDPEALTELEGTAAVVGHASADTVASIVTQLGRGPRPPAPLVVRRALDKADPEDLPPVEPVAVVHDRTRPFIKIQDGCDAKCTYCVIPEVRGAARSAPPDRVRQAVERLVDQGYLEIVLTGVHLGTYGEHLVPRVSFTDLVKDLLEVDGLGRLRLSCIEPMAFPLELADLAAAHPKLAPHFHLPLQAGADRTLKRMNRPYRGRDFVEVATQLRARLPRVCLGTDVIVGFPGETEDEFEETCRVIEDSALDYVHVFSYSDRPGVPSTRLPGKVGSAEIKRRANRLISISQRCWSAFLDQRVGTTLRVLTLQADPDRPDIVQALSDDYAPMRIEGRIEANRIIEARVARRDGAMLWGEPV